MFYIFVYFQPTISTGNVLQTKVETSNLLSGAYLCKFVVDMSVINPTDKLIRKLRKKLRQIERLELLSRSSLNEEELLKVSLLYRCIVAVLC